MKDHLRAILRYCCSTRCFKFEIRCLEERPVSSGIGAFDGLGMRIFDVISERGETMRREKEVVRAIISANEVRGFDQWTVRVIDIKNNLGLAHFGNAVTFQLLQHQRHGASWLFAVPAISSTADAVPVCLVDNV